MGPLMRLVRNSIYSRLVKFAHDAGIPPVNKLDDMVIWVTLESDPMLSGSVPLIEFL